MCSNNGAGSSRKGNNLQQYQHQQQVQPSGLSSFSLPSSSSQHQYQQLPHFTLVGQLHHHHQRQQQQQQQQNFVLQQYQRSSQDIAANSTTAALCLPTITNNNDNNSFLYDFKNHPGIGHSSPSDRLLDAAVLSGNNNQHDQHKTIDSTIPSVYVYPPGPISRATGANIDDSSLINVGGIGAGAAAAVGHATYPPQLPQAQLNNNFNSMKHQPTTAMSKAGPGKSNQHRQRSRRKNDTRNASIEKSTLKKAGTASSDGLPEERTTKSKSSSDLTIKLIKAGDIRSHDVLCGRDKATFNFIGNKRFRSSIGNFIPMYAAAGTKREKANVIVSAVRKIRNEDGSRFLKKYEASSSERDDEPNEELYVELDEVQARKKTGHALRDLFVARSQKHARRAARASLLTSKATAEGDSSQISSKSIETQASSKSSNESTSDKDDIEDDVSGYGLDDDRRQSDISVVPGTASSLDEEQMQESTKIDSKKKPRHRRRRQTKQQQHGEIEKSFSEESFSDSLSSMLPFVEEDTTHHGEMDGIEPLPAFTRPSSHQDLLQDALEPTTDEQSMAVKGPPPFPHPVFPGSAGTTQVAPHPYPVFVPFPPPTSTYVHSQHPSLYPNTFPFPPPVMHASPMHPHQHLSPLQQLNQSQQPESSQPEQPRTEQTEQQLQQYHMYHHHFYHPFPRGTSGSGGL